MARSGPVSAAIVGRAVDPECIHSDAVDGFPFGIVLVRTHAEGTAGIRNQIAECGGGMFNRRSDVHRDNTRFTVRQRLNRALKVLELQSQFRDVKTGQLSLPNLCRDIDPLTTIE
jgi:hypothetical protein